jgi:SNF family Na+-dependent transporter
MSSVPQGVGGGFMAFLVFVLLLVGAYFLVTGDNAVGKYARDEASKATRKFVLDSMLGR